MTKPMFIFYFSITPAVLSSWASPGLAAAVFVFKDRLNRVNVAGIVVCQAGLMMLN